MKISICPNCKWKILGDLNKDICGYCQVNKKLGISPIIIPQNSKDKPINNIFEKDIDLIVNLKRENKI